MCINFPKCSKQCDIRSLARARCSIWKSIDRDTQKVVCSSFRITQLFHSLNETRSIPPPSTRTDICIDRSSVARRRRQRQWKGKKLRALSWLMIRFAMFDLVLIVFQLLKSFVCVFLLLSAGIMLTETGNFDRLPGPSRRNNHQQCVPTNWSRTAAPFGQDRQFRGPSTGTGAIQKLYGHRTESQGTVWRWTRSDAASPAGLFDFGTKTR